ncbi:MAG: phosphoribosylanthranilate isomerase [Desulfovibrio sp.]|nr:phosphoribosylanthranilate isomerase [Desulfovibrio sp.]
MLIKICGMTRQEDLHAAALLGVDMCGFIFHPRSPRYIRPEKAAGLKSGEMKRVGVFVDETADDILSIMSTARLDYAQLHGDYSNEEASLVGAGRVIRVLWPERLNGLAEMENAMHSHVESCAAYLLDAGRFGGGSGKNLDWKCLTHLHVAHPWILSGGLDAERVTEALGICSPDGVDVNSGIEDAPGVKNREKMTAVVSAVRNQSK